MCPFQIWGKKEIFPAISKNAFFFFHNVRTCLLLGPPSMWSYTLTARTKRRRIQMEHTRRFRLCICLWIFVPDRAEKRDGAGRDQRQKRFTFGCCVHICSDVLHEHEMKDEEHDCARQTSTVVPDPYGGKGALVTCVWLQKLPVNASVCL